MSSPKTGPPSKIIDLQLEDLVLATRAQGDGLGKMVVRCNQDLARRGVEQTVSKSTVKRYLARLDQATVPVAHQPQVAQENAAVAIAFGERLNRLDELLGGWLEEAEAAVTPMRGVLWDPYRQAPSDPHTAREEADRLAEQLQDVMEYLPNDTARELRDWTRPSAVLVPDWKARTSIAREMRQLLETYADLMQRIHDAEQVEAFQQAVVDAIREASPEVAAAVLTKMREVQSIRKAALLGA